MNDIKKHIFKILLEEATNRKILYLHGLGGTPEGNGIEILQKDYDIIAPSLYYSKMPMWKYISDIIDTVKPIGIIGHSFGGYLAYYLSNRYKIPALMFNPAFKDEELYLLPIEEHIKDIIPFNEQMAVVGTKDNVVPPENQIEQLEKGYCEIYVEDIGHDIPKDILYHYSRIFISRL